MVKIENLKFGYSRDRLLFNDLSLSLRGGGIYGLLGRNGTGKTSLLKIMTGMRFPTSGNCIVLGEKPQKRLPSMLQEIIFVPEEIYVPDMSIATYQSVYAPFYPKFSDELFEKFIQEFDLKKADNLKSLSLGQKKQAVLSFAMATNAKLIILDEPTNGLDIPAKSQFRRIVASLAVEDNCIIISTHQAQDIEKLIDTVIILDGGDILLQSTTEDICNKLSFEVASTTLPNTFYSEEKIGGTYCVSKNLSGELSEFSLELFFNAVMANKQEMKNLFNTKTNGYE